MPGPALAYLVSSTNDGEKASIPIIGHLFVGRECSGVSPDHCHIIEGDAVSRTHMELHLDVDQDQAWLVDRSTNGTRLNGTRVERSVPVRIMPGDLIQVGSREFKFVSRRFAGSSLADSNQTVRATSVDDLVMAVGDIISFSTISEYTDSTVLLESVDRVYSELHKLLKVHRGNLSNYVGDAFFATWEAGATPDAAVAATRFALEAVARVKEIGPSLPLRDPSGQPIRMGFGVSSGQAAVSLMSGAVLTVLGDATNVTFRLSGLAGRSGWSDVLVTDGIHVLVSGRFAFTEPAEVEVKGRTRKVRIYGVSPAA